MHRMVPIAFSGGWNRKICASVRPCRLRLMQSHPQALPRLCEFGKPNSVALTKVILANRQCA
jgi:hypothetical protein